MEEEKDALTRLYLNAPIEDVVKGQGYRDDYHTVVRALKSLEDERFKVKAAAEALAELAGTAPGFASAMFEEDKQNWIIWLTIKAGERDK